MTDNINVYIDDILEVYKDLMDFVINPNEQAERMRSDLIDYYDSIIVTLEKIDEEFKTFDSIDNLVTQKCRLCSNLNGVRTGVLRFAICTKINNVDSLKTKYNKKLLSETILLIDSTISDKISNYISSIWFDQ